VGAGAIMNMVVNYYESVNDVLKSQRNQTQIDFFLFIPRSMVM
jgi:hypothetical protein